MFTKNPIILSTYSDMFQSILYCGVVLPNMCLFDFATNRLHRSKVSPLSSFPSTLGVFVADVVVTPNWAEMLITEAWGETTVTY